MAYSRWSNSKWYTYYKAGHYSHKHQVTFVICGGDLPDYYFTYYEIKKNIQACLDRVNGDDELKGYMLKFLSDVDSDYDKQKWR